MRVRLPKNQAIWYTDGKWGAISIDTKELIRCRLGGQHLLTQRASNAEIAADLCGAQAQILRNALFALQSRTGSSDFSGLLKTWTLRGTLHLIPESDLPLYVHQQGAAEDVCDTPWYGWMTKCGCALPPEREKAFARLMVQEIASGNDTREGLRQACQAAGMTADEEKMVFHGWGGVIGELSLLGVICAQVQEKKAYRLCAPFAPMDAAEAELRQWAAKEGKYLTGRFSPGYGDWDIAVQPLVANALDTVRRAGLCVTDPNLMTPRKSVTAILGVSGHPVKGKLAGCGHCVLRTRCEYRKRGKTCASE